MATLGPGIEIDVPRLLETRALFQANSGGGKSWALRRLLEQTATSVQQLVIDPEGEFSSLREKFDYIIAAPHDGDAVARPQTATLLARRLLESGVSAILNIYDLKAHERQEFVRLFCEALVNAPKSLWHPCMIVLDEAHVFCPEKGRAASTGAVIDLATRGRKRGFGLVLATQRLSKLHKDAAAEMLNKLIGRTGLDVDVSRAAEELGITSREAMARLRDMAPGEFYAFGPALAPGVTKVAIGPVQTTHPKSGGRLLASPPAPSAKILQVLSELEGIERDAKQESQSIDDLKRENATLKSTVTRLERRTENAGPSEEEIKRRIFAAMAQVERQANMALQRAHDRHKAALDAVRVAIERFAPEIPVVIAKTDSVASPRAEPAPTVIETRSRPVANAGMAGPDQRVLNALAWLESVGIPSPYSKIQVAFIAGYTPTGGSFNNTLGRLRSAGVIDYPSPGAIALLDAGRDLAQQPDTIPSLVELHRRVKERLSGPQQRVLDPLLTAYPDSLLKDDLAMAAGYQPSGGSFNNTLGSMRSLGIIDYPRRGHVIALPVLFPEGLA